MALLAVCSVPAFRQFTQVSIPSTFYPQVDLHRASGGSATKKGCGMQFNIQPRMWLFFVYVFRENRI